MPRPCPRRFVSYSPLARPFSLALPLLLLLVAPAVQAQDLVTDDMDLSSLVFDPQTLQASGQISVSVDNASAIPVAGSFEYVLFEDLDGNADYDAGTDNLLASEIINALPSIVSVGINATLQYRGSLIYGKADAQDEIAEENEGNNLTNSGLACEFEPLPAVFDPELEWSWNSSTVVSSALNVMMTPSVIDLNGDEIPDVVFGSTASTGGGLVEVGYLRALSGNDGSELFTVTDLDLRISTTCSVVTGDIDGDGRPEIIACDTSGVRLICFEDDGSFKWRTGTLEAIYWGGPSLADLDQDGTPEILSGRQVLDSNGNLLWTGTGGRGSQGTVGTISIAADVDLDGEPEVVAGNTVYSNAGAIEASGAYGDGHNATGNFDGDDFPEIVLVSAGVVRLLEHDMTQIWAMAIPGGGAGGPPTVADYDSDGEPEIGVAGASRYAVFDTDGSLIWAAVTQDGSSNRTGSSVFDFDGDGSAEVVYRDELFLRVYRGTDGAVLFQVPMSSCTWHEYVLVADVDADGNAEIVAVANNNCGYGPQRGVYVYGSASDSWVATRKIWNQHAYHITNVNDDGTIPQDENDNWLFPPASVYNNYRQNVLTTGSGSQLAAPDLTASYLQLDCRPDETVVTARIGNAGSVLVGTDIPVSFYEGDPNAGGVLLGTSQTSVVLDPGEFEDVSLVIGGAFEPTDPIWVVADDSGGLVSTENECDESNNAHGTVLSCADECEDVDLVLVDYETVAWDPNTLIWEVIVRIRNDGSDPASNVDATLIEEIAWVTPIDGLSHYGDIAPGEIKAGDSYTLDLTGRPDDQGFNVFFTVTYDCDGPQTVVLDPPFVTPGEDGHSAKRRYALDQNWPNPFNPSTTISFSLEIEGPVRLEVFDARGRLIRTLVDRTMSATRHDVQWNGTDDTGRRVGSGLYYYRLTVNDEVLTRKMTLLK